MRTMSLLQKIFKKSLFNLDIRLHLILLEAANCLAKNKQLSISCIGRKLNRKAKVKHNVKTIDRLFGNKNLANKKLHIYKDCVNWIVGNNKQPIIIIDWSGLTKCGEFHFLRASIPVGGRSLPILDMAFNLKDYMTQKAHKEFIDKLEFLLADDCKPIIVTDAGFRCPWFKLINNKRWDFVGRVRHLTKYQSVHDSKWYPVKSLYKQAKTTAGYLFKTMLAKCNSVNCYFYIIKNRKKGRVRKNLAGKKIQCSVSKKHAKSGDEPWLLVSSLSPDEYSATQIVNIYKKRMQIEEGFRDLKNTKNGFSLRHCRSYKINRLNVALLISAIATLLLWLLSIVAKEKKLHFGYQTNSIKTRNVLSCVVIGWQFLCRDIKSVTLNQAMAIINKSSELNGGIHEI